jgi:tetratricopeptide (TPR) repeat protein
MELFVKILSRLFSKSPTDLLAKGDNYFDSDRYFDARTCYEDGLQKCSDDGSPGNQREIFKERITRANLKLAELNLAEAEFAFSRGDSGKAIDHLDLLKTLTYDICILEKAEQLLKDHSDSGDNSMEAETSSSCATCSQIQVDDYAGSQYADETLHPLEYFELLIGLLPENQFQRYSELGEDFAYAYVAACQDKHSEALSLFEKWSVPDSCRDIYYCERGKVLHRLGNELEAEQQLRRAIQLNDQNYLAWLNLALLLFDGGRLDETMGVLDFMISKNMMAEQAMLMRGEILESTGNLDEAIDQYSSLLTTQYARSAAEKLHGVLLKSGRHRDAELVFKKFLAKCGH